MITKKVFVKTGKNQTELIESGDEWIINLKARPVEGKANGELIKFLSKKFKCKVEIVSGFTSKKKVVRLLTD